MGLGPGADPGTRPGATPGVGPGAGGTGAAAVQPAGARQSASLLCYPPGGGLLLFFDFIIYSVCVISAPARPGAGGDAAGSGEGAVPERSWSAKSSKWPRLRRSSAVLRLTGAPRGPGSPFPVRNRGVEAGPCHAAPRERALPPG